MKKLETINKEIENIKTGIFRTEKYNNENKKLAEWA